MIEHMAGFFDDFSVAVTLPSTAVVRGIFDNGASRALDIMTTGPSLTVQTADIASLTTGQTVDVAGTDYVVRAIDADGTGISTLALEVA